jgi:hypothetical protein
MGRLIRLKDKYPKMEYSATEIVMDTKRIHHQKSGLKLVPIMEASLTLYLHGLFFIPRHSLKKNCNATPVKCNNHKSTNKQ